MTILENSFFHLSTLLFLLFGLGALILSYLKRKYEYSAVGFISCLIGFFSTLFLAALKGDLLILSNEIDFGANFVFSLSSLILGIVSIIGMLVFYRHRIVPAMFIQLGIFLCSVLILVTFSGSISKSLVNKPSANEAESAKFLKSEDFAGKRRRSSVLPKLKSKIV
jgi:hypothetical protein